MDLGTEARLSSPKAHVIDHQAAALHKVQSPFPRYTFGFITKNAAL